MGEVRKHVIKQRYTIRAVTLKRAVLAVIPNDRAYAKKGDKAMQNTRAFSLLGHLYFKRYTYRAIGLGLETYLKMTFSIHKACYVPRLKTRALVKSW